MRIRYEIEFGFNNFSASYVFLFEQYWYFSRRKLALELLNIALCSIFDVCRCDHFEATIFTISTRKKKTAKGHRASVVKELFA